MNLLYKKCILAAVLINKWFTFIGLPICYLESRYPFQEPLLLCHVPYYQIKVL